MTNTYQAQTNDSRSYNMANPYQSGPAQQRMNMSYGQYSQFNPATASQPPPPPPGRAILPNIAPLQPPPGPQGFTSYPGPSVPGSSFGNQAYVNHQGYNVPVLSSARQSYNGPVRSYGHQDFRNQQASGIIASSGPPLVNDRGVMQVPNTYQIHNHYSQPAGPFNYPTQAHAPYPVRSYAPFPYDAGPMENFSSRPPVQASQVRHELAYQTSLGPRINDAGAFSPMKRILIEQGKDVQILIGPKQTMGKAAGPKVPDHVNCCLYLEGLHPQTTYADLFNALRGKILRTHITPANSTYPTAAAKVGFFKRIDALRTYSAVKAGHVYIKGRQVRTVKWNWDGYSEDE